MLNQILMLLALFAPLMLIGTAVKGVNRTKMDTPTPANRLTPGEFDGRVKVMIDSYAANALAQGSTIDVGGLLPIGAKVLEVVLMADALGGSVTLAVGDSTTAARYILATAMNTGNKVVRINAIDGRGYTVTSTTRQVVITTAGAVATGDIKVEIYFTND